MNFRPPEEDDPRDDDQRQQAADTKQQPVAADLTDEQINELRMKHGVTSNGRGIREFSQVADFARAIAALGSAPATPVPASEPVAVVSSILGEVATVRLRGYAVRKGDKLYAAPTAPASRELDAINLATQAPTPGEAK